jgi:uncharacterized protein with PQ loop repeat
MDISNILLLMNICISILHPIKHIPQIYHTINTRKAEDLSKLNIVCELGLNLLSLTSCILVYVYMGKQTFFLPILVEKASSTIFICIIYNLKIKYTKMYAYEEIKQVNEIDPIMPMNPINRLSNYNSLDV